jgi:hypothetical protein
VRLQTDFPAQVRQPPKSSKSHVACEVLPHQLGHAPSPTIRIDNGLLPSKFTFDLKARSARDAS